MTETNQTEDEPPAAEAQQGAAKASDTKTEATSTAKASDELSEDDLEAVAGGGWVNPKYPPTPILDA
jgi:hypothetical protein